MDSKLWDALVCFFHSGMGKGSGDRNKWNRGNDLLNCSGCGHSEYVSVCLISGMRATNPLPAVSGKHS